MLRYYTAPATVTGRATLAEARNALSELAAELLPAPELATATATSERTALRGPTRLNWPRMTRAGTPARSRGVSMS